MNMLKGTTMIKNLEKHNKVRDIKFTKKDLIDFEQMIVEHWENVKIRGPIHLSNGNEEPLIEIFKYNHRLLFFLAGGCEGSPGSIVVTW